MGLFIREIPPENTTGQLPPVVLLHGFCEDHSIWSNVLPVFRNRKTFLVDLPGFGRSEAALAQPVTIDGVADVVYNSLIQAKGIEPVVIGHSLGGYVALALAEKYGLSIHGIGLVHSTAFADTSEKRESRNKVIAFVKEHGVAAYTSQFVPGLFHSVFRRQHSEKVEEVANLAGKTPAPTLIAYAEAMRERPDRRRILTDFGGSKFVIAGDKDAAVPLEQSLILKDLVGEKNFILLEGVAHMGMFENPVACSKALYHLL